MAPESAHRGWISLAVRRPIALVMIFSAVGVFGLISLGRLPVDLMPDVTRPTITVRTDYPGAAPEDVEDRVSRRLEKSLSVVKGLRRVTSISRAGTSDVILEFSWDADLRAGVQDIREKLDQTFLPDDADTPTVLRYDPRLEPVLLLGLEGPLDLRTLRRIAEEDVERRLETVEGIAAVRVRGGLEEEIGILVDEERLRSRGLTLEDVGRRLAEENLDQASGQIYDGEVRYIVRTRGELATLDDIRELPIRSDGDSVLRLSDVASVESRAKEERVITRIDGRPAVWIEILREGDANIVDLASRVRARIFGTPGERAMFERWLAERESPTEVEPSEAERSRMGAVRRPDYVASWIPPETRLVVLADQSVFIEAAIRDLQQTAILGGILAILVLFLFLGRLSYTAVVAVTIPVSVIATFAPMHIGGISLNIMSLGGLALGIGMLVDSAIVVLESIFRRREEGLDAIEAAIVGGRDVAGAVVASTLTTVAVFLPIVFVEGMAGQFFRDQALAVVFSLLAALVVSLTLVPMLAARLGALGATRGRARLGPYRWSIGPRVRTFLLASGRGAPREFLWGFFFAFRLAYCLFAAFLDSVGFMAHKTYGGALAVLGYLGRQLGRGGGIVVRPAVTAFRAAYEGTEAWYLRAISFALGHRGEVLTVVAATVGLALWAVSGLGSELVPQVSRGEFTVHVRYAVGTPIEMTDRYARDLERPIADLPAVATVATIVGRDPEELRDTQEGEHTVRLQVQIDRTGREDLAETEARLAEDLAAIIGRVDDHEWEIRRPSLFSLRSPLEIEIRGPDLAVLRRIDRDARAILSTIPELREVRSSVAPGSPEYHLFPDRDALARHGITSQQIADVIRRKNLGEVVSRFREGDRRIDMRVQVRPEDRESIDDLLALVVAPRGGGDGLRLGDLLASWEPREGPAEIRRIERQRAVVISADIVGIDLGRIAETIETRLLGELRLPADVSVEVVGQKKEMERSLGSLLAALGLAVFLVYVVMASQFESLKQPFVILFTIPLAAVGVIGTLWITGTPMSVMTFIGMIVLAGIVVNNAIVLLDQVNRLRAEGHPVREALVEGGRRRLRPILMTTSTTVLALLPVTGVLSRIPHPASLDLLFGSGEGAEIRAPLALTVIGGLISSTVLTLVVCPVIYSLVSPDPRGGPAGEPTQGAAS